MPLSVRNGRTSGARLTIAGEPATSGFLARWAENYISPGYFDAIGIARRQGRDFTAADTAGTPPVAIVNETFVRRYLSGRTPIGLRTCAARELLEEVGLAVDAAALGPLGPSSFPAPGMIGEPVEVGGATIRQGDVVVLDSDGAVVVERERFDEVLEAGLAREARESEKRAKLEAGEHSYDLDGLRQLVEQ